MAVKLLITIDTEPDNMWDDASRKNPAFKNIAELDKLQKLFNRFRVRPVYLVSFSVAASDMVSFLKAIEKSENCEIGAHLHALETPPFESPEKGDGSYLHQYAQQVQREKFVNLDNLLTRVFGRKAVSYRGGRWSLDKNAVTNLCELGFLVDSSVIPNISWENDGGINFKKWPAAEHYLGNGGKCGLLEIPVSTGIKTKLGPLAKYMYLNTPNWTHTQGILRRVAGFNIVSLDPSFNKFEDMKWLCDKLLAQGNGYLNIAFHSGAVIAAGTPYTMTQAAVDTFFSRLENLLDYLLNEKKLENMTLKEFYAYRNSI